MRRAWRRHFPKASRGMARTDGKLYRTGYRGAETPRQALPRVLGLEIAGSSVAVHSLGRSQKQAVYTLVFPSSHERWFDLGASFCDSPSSLQSFGRQVGGGMSWLKYAYKTMRYVTVVRCATIVLVPTPTVILCLLHRLERL